MMRYISMFSGIEAASVALEPLDCEPICFSETSSFPSAVLAHRFPRVPNVGDMTKHDWRQYRGQCDLVIGGPPCQAFSIAGMRGGLSDDRGNLSLQFVKAVHAIRPLFMLAENVPGWLSMPDNAFGCFLAGLVGADDPLLPSVMPGGRKGNALWRWDEDSQRLVPKWPSAGLVAGPWARAAWRVLNAQHFGLAQRRERVFVVAGFGDRADPAEILFERKGVHGNPPPRREKGKDLAPTISARTSAGGGLGTDFDLDGGLVHTAVTHSLRAEGFDASEDGTGRGTPIVPVQSYSLNGISEYGAELATLRATGGDCVGGSEALAVFAIQERAVSENLENGPQGKGFQPDIAYTLEARNKVQAVAFGGNRQGGSIDVAAALNAKGGSGRMDFETETLIAFSSKDHGADAQADLAPTMRAMGHNESHANAGGQLAVAFAIRGREGGAMPEMEGDTAGALRAASGGSSRSYVATSNLETNKTEGIYQLTTSEVDTYGNATEANTRKILRRVREEIGEEALSKWGLGILIQLQSPEILRPILHGCELRPASFSRCWVEYCALSCEEDRSEGALQSLREAKCKGRSSSRWRPPEQLGRQLGAYLSDLSQQGAQAERFVHDLWEAAEGIGVLRQALSEVQGARRSSCSEAQPISPGHEGRGDLGSASMLSSSVRGEIEREGAVREALHASEESAEVSPERRYGVRRLTPRRECERLQGFHDDYTRIPWRGRLASECPDGPRYKALGNSFAVPVVRWIGTRIMAQYHRLKSKKEI